VKSIHYVKDGNEEMKALDSVNVRDTVIIQQKYQPLVKFAPVEDSTAKIQLVENLNDKIDYKFSAKTNHSPSSARSIMTRAGMLTLMANRPHCPGGLCPAGFVRAGGGSQHRVPFLSRSLTS